ncbi:hypothetical protein PTTG_06976 [Puccinia triticina 1-1 BBBD Race 1]|uniref:Tyr recombinase domain-containing protein n=1 Tax=Puccinia triticina (isolate 1-1 / race 1 (BBBD)) TaxID=630390 RepID=A0A180G8D4_PUCT1|nr:hypothetical protein PTTG_06976 [Puccinia triticina 1-1 BBBD Race 1]
MRTTASPRDHMFTPSWPVVFYNTLDSQGGFAAARRRLWKNFKFNSNPKTIRSAKTASPGKPQLIVLSTQRGVLCPVKAVKRRLAKIGTARTSLFGYQLDGQRVHLTRRDAVSRIQQAVAAGGHDIVLGHSFRVGGASLRFALGTSTGDICSLGRWSSACYKLYIRPYSAEDTRRSKVILNNAACDGEELE